jgi:hypothetical protein
MNATMDRSIKRFCLRVISDYSLLLRLERPFPRTERRYNEAESEA